jgi:hypothetical protein
VPPASFSLFGADGGGSSTAAPTTQAEWLDEDDDDDDDDEESLFAEDPKAANKAQPAASVERQALKAALFGSEDEDDADGLFG